MGGGRCFRSPGSAGSWGLHPKVTRRPQWAVPRASFSASWATYPVREPRAMPSGQRKMWAYPGLPRVRSRPIIDEIDRLIDRQKYRYRWCRSRGRVMNESVSGSPAGRFSWTYNMVAPRSPSRLPALVLSRNSVLPQSSKNPQRPALRV